MPTPTMSSPTGGPTEKQKRLAHAIKTASPRMMEPAAITATIQATREARKTLAEAGNPVQEYFRRNSDLILGHEGLLDHWLTTVALIAMELALAPPDGPITAAHVEEAKRRPCTSYPECNEMMLRGFLA